MSTGVNNNQPETRRAAVRPVPGGYGTVTPFVIVRGAANFLEFLQAAFDAEELGRVTGEDGSISHAETRIGDSIVMLFDAKADWPDTPSFLRLYVKDAHATYRQALAARATSVTEVTYLPWGDYTGRVRDPFGNLWWIMQRVEDLTEAEIGQRYGEQKYIDAMNYVQGAQFLPSNQ